MVYVKWVFVIACWLLVAAFLHYTLPQTDILRITDTYEKRIDFGENSIFWSNQGTGEAENTPNRDVFFIQTVRTDGDVMVYRNEDTGWGWPPYFKLDSSNLQTEAEDAKSTEADPKWVVVTHYGWRNEVFSIFPNAVGIRPIDDPNRFLIPWVNIVLLIVLAGLMLGFYRLTQWFRREKIDPIVEGAGETWETVDNYADEKRAGFKGWLDTWRGKPRK